MAINRIEFGILSPDEIRRNSVALIQCSEMYENKRPKIGGLADPRMGCTDRDMTCYTCNGTVNTCPGHFGHIELNTGLFHIGFIKVVKKILECVCHKCSRFRLTKDDTRYKRLLHANNKFKTAWDLAKTKVACAHCETQLFPIRRQGITLFQDPRKIDPELGRIELTPDLARQILEHMSDETCELIGLNPVQARPEWMVLTVLPVPPPCVRPSITMDYNGRGEDDLTHMLNNIIRYNKLVEKDSASEKLLAGWKEQLHIHVTSYMDNEFSGVPPALQKGGRPIKSICARLKGKEGRIRGNLMGKRVDFSARTVITGDPNLSIEDVGVPLSVAQNLTYPETINERNITKFQAIVDSPKPYPSVKFVLKEKGGRRIDMKFAKRRPVLQIGDVVERHMVDGDLVLFNRQPTLHKMSAMAHRARIMTGSTFRLNVNVCASYNADFDGDEMNMHMPQSVESRAELHELSRVSTLLVSGQSSKPVNALVQDGLTGVYLFTQQETFLTRDKVMQLMMEEPPVRDTKANFTTRAMLPAPCILKPVPLWSGKQIFSALLPPVQYSTRGDEGDVLIRNGELVKGVVCKKTVGTASGGLIHLLWLDFGADVARDFLDTLARMMSRWLTTRGFSVGIGDTTIPVDVQQHIKDLIDQQYKKTDLTLNMYRDGQLMAKGGMTVEETKELQVQDFLSKARDGSGNMVNAALNHTNNIKRMIGAGSKGSALNISQITAVVGQQIVDGCRVPFGFESHRTLPHFLAYDDSPESRGFVRHSLVHGLAPHEVFFHAMGGREGLIDTAVKTADSGYIQRRLVKSLEDVFVQYDGTVRNARGDVIQFLYGEDGFDGAELEHLHLDLPGLSDAELHTSFFNEFCPQELDVIKRDRDFLRHHYRSSDEKIGVPVNLIRLKKYAIQRDRHGNRNGDLVPANVLFDRVSVLREKLRPARILYCGDHNPSHLFGIFLSSTFATRKIGHLSAPAIDWLLDRTEQLYNKALVHAGEAVGVVAAQSIGEPATQMTLNTFHLSGTGNAGVLSGIPRLKELINAVKTLRTPSMTIHLDKSIRHDRRAARRVVLDLENVTFRYIVSQMQVLRDPDYTRTNVEQDAAWLRNILEIPDPDMPNPTSLSPWFLRITLCRDAMQRHNLSMEHVSDVFHALFQHDFFILHSDNNDLERVMHFRVHDDPTLDSAKFFAGIQNEFGPISIRGVPGIRSAVLAQKPIRNADGEEEDEFYIETIGLNFQEVLLVSGIDCDRLTSNDPHMMADCYGIEVARATLLNEIQTLIQASGSHLNVRHLTLLCDLMTRRGGLSGITRYGTCKSVPSPLSRASNEQANDVLFEAASHGLTDDIETVSARLIVSKQIPYGTNICSFLPAEV